MLLIGWELGCFFLACKLSIFWSGGGGNIKKFNGVKIVTNEDITAERNCKAACVSAGLERAETCQLVEELKKREGVDVYLAEPYKDLMVNVNGPAVVLVVID